LAKHKKPKNILRSLYDCKFARVNGERIYCAWGIHLSPAGYIDLARAARGEPLVCAMCQLCDFFELSDDEPIKPTERGWTNGTR